MKAQHAEKEIQFDWVFLNCVKVIYVCDFRNNTMEKIVLPQNAENFLNTEAEYLKILKGLSRKDVRKLARKMVKGDSLLSVYTEK